MKRILKKLDRGEKGQALIVVTILLLLGFLIIAPLMGYMSTGLKAGQIYEERTEELYAADSGVEDALWLITTNAANLPTAEIPDPLSYNMADVNGKQVACTIAYEDERTYKVISTATTNPESSTTIESYITVPDFNFVLEHAITTRANAQIGGNTEVKGDIKCPEGQLDLDPGAIWDDIEYEQDTEQIPDAEWPSEEMITWFYEWDVKNLLPPNNPYLNNVIDVKTNPNIEPLKRYGDLEIINKGVAGLTATLNGTVYVTGNLDIAMTNKDFTLAMNGQTIFVEGEINGGTKLTLMGSGCIIALGRIDLHPHIASSEGEEKKDFILIMSVTDEVKFQPLENYYGAVVGDGTVDLQPNCYLEWHDPDECGVEINFPWEGFTGGKVITKIRTWEISLQ